MATDTNIEHLVINKMTQAQYDSATKSANELYLTPESPASTTNLGPVKVDGSTITADQDGTIHAHSSGSVNDGKLTIKRNNVFVGDFTANQATDEEINITVPTSLSELTYDIMNKIYPVGSIYMSATLDTAAKVHNALGGTWQAWGKGRVPVGVDSTQTEFSTTEKTGGEKTHTLSVNEMPSHSHEAINYDVTFGGSQRGYNTPLFGGGETADHINTVRTTGGGQAHNNLQPYITCYMWKRTA